MSAQSLIHCVQDVHVKELVKRLNWSVKIRWYVIACCNVLVLLFVLFIDQQRAALHYDYLFAVSIFLFFCNAIYQYQLRYSFNKCLNTKDLRYYLLLQIMTDFIALTLVVYTFGSIESPILIMIIPNIILATLFFTPTQSLRIVLSGLLLLLTPVLLEFMHLIPVISIVDKSFKLSLFAAPVVFFSYLFIYLLGVLFCWYLLASITSQLIKNELRLERSYQDMIQLDKQKTQATLRSTHELKAPLAAIKNYVYTVDAGYAGEVNDRLKKIIQRIGRRCDYLLNNVTDIIKLGNLKSYVVLQAQSELNNRQLQFYPLDISQYISAFIAQNKSLAIEKKITINEHSAIGNKNYIIANEQNLQLIFTNLLTNAINYSPSEGIIDIVLTQQNRHICVSIKDQGIGIEQQFIEQIFEEHFRTRQAAQFYEGGTGLGLSIVKVCSEILDAKITIESTMNQGTCVMVCFKKKE